MTTRKMVLLLGAMMGALISVSSVSHSAEKVGQAVKFICIGADRQF